MRTTASPATYRQLVAVSLAVLDGAPVSDLPDLVEDVKRECARLRLTWGNDPRKLRTAIDTACARHQQERKSA